MRKVFSYGLIVYRKLDDEFQVLLIKSSLGHWDFPKGHVDDSDSSKYETAKRETLEEVNLEDLRILDNFAVNYDYVVDSALEGGDEGNNVNQAGVHKFLELFLAEYLSGEIELSDEHTEYAWVNLDQGLELLEYDNSKGALISAYNFLLFYD